MSRDELEAPGTDDDPDWDSLYLYRGDEVVAHRPLFTGDVYDVGEMRVIVLQHPCALRQGIKLVPRLLVAEVERHQELSRAQWTTGSFKVMPLPNLDTTGVAYAAKFLKIAVMEADAFEGGMRVACLSPLGVNLLSQRWVNHNTRVVIPKSNYFEVMVGPFEEADIIEEWIEVGQDRLDPDSAQVEVDEWLGQAMSATRTRRDALEDAEMRPTIRRAAREQARRPA